jgi:hypothetical protein
MLDFSGKDEKARDVCLHYATQLGQVAVIPFIEGKVAISSKEEALVLSQFFWDMLEACAGDRDNQVVVLGEQDLQYWMERSMNIISGYLTSIGYEEEWEKVSDDA